MFYDYIIQFQLKILTTKALSIITVNYITIITIFKAHKFIVNK